MLTPAPVTNDAILIKRKTPATSRLVDYQNGSVLKEENLDLDSNQLFYLQQEAIDALTMAQELDGSLYQSREAILNTISGWVDRSVLIPDLTGDIGDLQTQLEWQRLFTDIDEMYENETYYRSYVDALDGRTTIAEGRLDVHDTDITAAVSRITVNEGDIVAAEGRLTVNEGSITAAVTRLDGHDTDISTLQLTDQGLDVRVTSAEGNITSQDGRLTTAEGTITTHGSQLALEANQFKVKVNANGRVAGFGLYNDAQQDWSEFILQVDKFGLIKSDDLGGIKKPFVIDGTTGNVAIDGSLLVTGSIATASIAADAITGDLIAGNTLDGTHIKASSSISLNTGGKLTIGASGELEIGVDGILDIGEDGKLTVGNNNIIIDGTLDEIAICPSGGKTGNDYCRLTNGELDFFYYDGSSHVSYKSLKRVEAGQAASGNTVYIPGYWKSAPKIILSPANFPIYDETYTGQDQTMKLEVQSLQLQSGETMKYQFQPQCSLELAAGTGGYDVNTEHTAASTVDITSTTVSGLPANARKLTVNFRYQGWREARKQWDGGEAFQKVAYTVNIKLYSNGTLRAQTGSMESSTSGYTSINLDTGTLTSDITNFYIVVDVTYGGSLPSGYTSWTGTYKNSLWIDTYSTDLLGVTELATGTVNWIAIGE